MSLEPTPSLVSLPGIMKRRSQPVLPGLAFLALVAITPLHAILGLNWLGDLDGIGDAADPANWSGQLLGDGSDSVVFGLSPTTTVRVADGLALTNITFADNDRPSYTFQGADGPATLTLLGDLLVATSGGNVVFNPTLDLTLTEGTHFVDIAANTSVLVGGKVDGAGAGLEKSGDGTLALSGQSTFDGGVTVSAGTLLLGSSSFASPISEGFSILSGPAGTGTLVLASGATLGVNTGTVTLHNGISLSSSAEPGEVTISTASGDLALLGTIITSWHATRINKDGTGTLTLGGVSGFHGGVAVNAGTLLLSSSSSNYDGVYGPVGGDTLLLFNGTTLGAAAGQDITLYNLIDLDPAANSNVTIHAGANSTLRLYGDISHASSLTKTGAGTVVLGSHDIYAGEFSELSENDFQGGFNLQAGTLLVGSSSYIGEGGIIFGPIGSGALKLHNGTTLGTAGSEADLELHNPIHLDQGAGSAAIDISNSNTLDLRGDISGTAGIYKTGAGLLTLSGNNSFAGDLYVAGGTLEIESDTAAGLGKIGFGSSGGTVVFNADAPVIHGLYGGSEGALNLASEAMELTIDQDVDTSFAGAIYETNNANAGLIKQGLGTLTLTGSNAWEGGTTIDGGTLAVTGSSALGNGDVTVNATGTLALKTNASLYISVMVNAGGRLAGEGFLNDAIIGDGALLASGGILSPGLASDNRIGSLSFNDLTLNENSVLEIELLLHENGSVEHDQVNVVSSNTLFINSTTSAPLTLKLISLDLAGSPGVLTGIEQGTEYSLIFLSYHSGIVGDLVLDENLVIDASGLVAPGWEASFNLHHDQTSFHLSLTFAAVPEPSTYALMALGLGFVILAARRRR